MATQELPILPRVGFATIITLSALNVLVFGVLFLTLPSERNEFVLPILAMLAALIQAWRKRRQWLSRHRAPGHDLTVPAPRTPQS